MKRLPMVAPSCSLSSAGLAEQIERYRRVGQHARLIEWNQRRGVVEVHYPVSDQLIDRLFETERACCPFFELTWDEKTRRLTISVDQSAHEPALAAVGQALGVGGRSASADYGA